MDWEFAIGVILRWMHILAAVTAVGGTIFARLALVPSLGVFNEDARGKLHEAIRQHWGKPVQIAISFLLISGIINIIIIEKTYFVSQVPSYHIVFGIKFVLAFVVFFLASALTGHGNATQRFRDNSRYWLTVNMILAIIIVCLSGILRKTELPRKPLSYGAPSIQSLEIATSNEPNWANGRSGEPSRTDCRSGEPSRTDCRSGEPSRTSYA